MRTQTSKRCSGGFAVVLAMIVASLVLPGCGGGSAAPSEADASAGAGQTRRGQEMPTMPAAQFAQPTTMIDPTRVAETRTTPEAEEVDLDFGAQAYARHCADCHGEEMVGVAGKAEPITAYELDEAGLTDLLRTGGGYGPEHIFGLDKISPDGLKALHAYMQGLFQSD